MVASDDLERRFAALATRFADDPDVTEGTGFGKTPGLRTGGKIFAMLVQGRFVVKLPRERVDALVASGDAEPFEAGRGRPMKEWAAVKDTAAVDWEALAVDAREFVSGGRRS